MSWHTLCCSSTTGLCGETADTDDLTAGPRCPDCQVLDAARVPCSLGCPFAEPYVPEDLDDEQPDDDPHAGCYLPHLGPDGPVDCDGRPL